MSDLNCDKSSTKLNFNKLNTWWQGFRSGQLQHTALPVLLYSTSYKLTRGHTRPDRTVQPYTAVCYISILIHISELGEDIAVGWWAHRYEAVHEERQQ